MIIRQIKIIKQSQHVLESLKQVDQDMSSQDWEQSQPRMLNPEQPQVQRQTGIIDNFVCQTSEPLFLKDKIKPSPLSCLTIETPLSCQPENIAQKTQPEQIKRQPQPQKQEAPSKQFKKHNLPKYSINRNWRHYTTRNNDNKLRFSSNTFAEQAESKTLEKKQSRYDKNIEKVPILDQLHKNLNEKPDEEQNQTLKSKTQRSYVRSRLAQTLHKFNAQKRKQTKNREHQPQEQYRPRYSKSLQVQKQQSKSIHTQKNDAKTILDHLRSRTSAIQSQKVNKRTVPHDDSADQQFSTIFGNTEHPKASDSEEQIIPISYFQPRQCSRERITISYKTTLLQLKQICLRQNIDEEETVVLIPEPLSAQLFTQDQDQQETFFMAKKLLINLAIDYKTINIKRYSNCVIVICGYIAIISNFNGKIYLGGWSNNTKTGLGLEWLPNKYIYYGEFKNNKRNGVGVYKSVGGDVASGMWKNNIFEGHLRELESGSRSKVNSMRIQYD